VVAEDSTSPKEVKQLEHEADHVPPSGAEAKNACRCLSTLWASMMYTGTHKLGGMRKLDPVCVTEYAVGRFPVLTPLLLKFPFFWDVMPCCLADSSLCFKRL